MLPYFQQQIKFHSFTEGSAERYKRMDPTRRWYLFGETVFYKKMVSAARRGPKDKVNKIIEQQR